MSRIKVLGVGIDNLDEQEALEKAEALLLDKKQCYIVTPNPEFIVRAQTDEEFKQILNQADLVVADGVGLIYASRFLGQPLKQRITGINLMEKICQQASKKGWQILLLGAKPGIAEKAAQNLKGKYQGLKIEFYDEDFLSLRSASRRRSNPEVYHGIATPRLSVGARNDSICNDSIKRILFVALGAPKQEKWIVENLAKMPEVGLAVGVGGAFDFISGKAKRAPKFWQTIGFEWLWRLLTEPWRIKRIFNAVVVFPLLVLKAKIKKAA